MRAARSTLALFGLISLSGCDEWPLDHDLSHGSHGEGPKGHHHPPRPPDTCDDGGVEAPRLEIGLNFTGSTYLVDSFVVPPDTNGAVGKVQIVELLNGHYAVYGKANGVREQTSSLDEFWISAGVPPVGFVVDPRVLHDPESRRWFASSLDIRSGSDMPDRLLLAVSLSEDATAGWIGFGFEFVGPNGIIKADFPTLGLNGEGVYLYSNGTVIVVPKADLVGALPTFAGATFLTSAELLTPTGNKQQPIVNLDNAPLPEPLFSAYDTNAGLFRLTRVLGPITAPTLDTSDGFIAVPPFDTLGNVGADQPDSDINVFGGSGESETSVVMHDNSIWGVHTVVSEGRAAVRWFELDASANELLQNGLIADPTRDVYMGSIAINARGDVVIGFNMSNDTLFVSSYAVLGTTLAGSTTFGTPLLLKAGVAPFEITGGAPVARWGDYSTTVVDPKDPSVFWTFQEWPSALNVWSTQITQLRIRP